MTRRAILTLIALAVIIFWSGLFAVLPWYIPVAGALVLVLLFSLLIYFEGRLEIPQPSGEEMAAGGDDLWTFPQHCHEAPDPYRKAA